MDNPALLDSLPVESQIVKRLQGASDVVPNRDCGGIRKSMAFVFKISRERVDRKSVV